ncbi:MAG: outer membrane lipid asymmetry maintenance protein MlaD [Rickettsiales bacterium]|jgi:phospholipid/cholesterol/gamma-HCH transport system substrate-binding protein|nr:outer membrane lipid asymmetry maintenance protein MlaD [Rickettsiales bacterium]
MKDEKIEIIVGAIVLLVSVVFLAYILIIYGKTSKVTHGYNVIAEFSNIADLTIGNDVKISGVKVGTVSKIGLNSDYNAVVTMSIQDDLNIPNDSIFKISTVGLMGSKFVDVKIGGSEEYLSNNSSIDFTESALSLEDLISRFVLNSGNDKNKK